MDYNNDIADGDAAIIQDAAANTVWEDRITATGAGVPLRPFAESSFNPPHRMQGLLAPTLTHGKVYIYLDQARTSVPVKA